MRLDGQRVVVIGGSSGIGLGIAKVAAWAGAHVVVAGRSAEKFEAAKAEVGREVECRVLDATDGGAVRALFADLGWSTTWW